MVIRAPFFRAIHSWWDTYILRRPFYYGTGERRLKDKRRAYVAALVEEWHAIRPDRNFYATVEEYQAAVWMWDDGQRAIAAALKAGDRRRNPQVSFSTLLAARYLSEAS